ncbi:MAG TPA: nicotinamide-nucleotide amidohydrolase family protein [Cellvibrio sp.]|nr:nicotinamide-nucleotide amidohydrolase family protein [Cellvibrio sp.]
MDYLSPAQQNIYSLSELLGQQLLARHWHVATAESCTGGAIAAAITQVAGSSAWFEYGVVTYANRAKQHLLEVQDATLAEAGAVSEAVVVEMARGALALSRADMAVAVSGIAGPTGGSADKPVGTVWFAWALASGEVQTQKLLLPGDRIAVQLQAVEHGLRGLLDFIP